MDTESRTLNGDQGSDPPQPPVPREYVSSSGSQDNGRVPRANEISSPPEGHAREINPPEDILQQFITDGRRFTSFLNDGLTTLEEFGKMNVRFFLARKDESKTQRNKK